MPIELRDNNSQFISKIPKELVEPLILIAKIKGFDSGIDDYIVDLIENDLISMRNRSRGSRYW